MYEELVKSLHEEGEYADLVAYMHGIRHISPEDVTAKIARSWKELFAKAADAIEELSKPRWIPVAERLPEKNGKYLCYVKRFGQYAGMQYYYVDVLVFQEDCFFEDGIGTERVTHWMPLPMPPKEET